MNSSAVNQASPSSLSQASICKHGSPGPGLQRRVRSPGQSGNEDMALAVFTERERRLLLTAVTSLRFENLKSLISVSKQSSNDGHFLTSDELIEEGTFLDVIIAKLGEFV